MRRRDFLKTTAVGGLTLTQLEQSSQAKDAPKRTFRVWAMGCSHVGTDIRKKRESLAEAIRHSESGGDDGGSAFDWDIALHLGDLAGAQGGPDDEEGREVVRQFAAAKKHRREHFYNLAGNHDANIPGQPSMGWFRKWVDPTGENRKFSGVDPNKRPYPIEGVWERYAFRVGNLLFLMMSDRNDGGPPVGRAKRGGYPAGAVAAETFAWWKSMVEQNKDSIIVSAHHHMLKETTMASGEYEGFKKTETGKYRSYYHGYFPAGGPKGASYLYFVDRKPDAQAFERYLAENSNAIDFWLGGHTHSHPDDDKGGRTHIENKWGGNFVNCAALAKYHARLTTIPMSRLFTFREGSNTVRIQCYLHTSDHAKQGWYAKAERTVEIGKPFRLA